MFTSQQRLRQHISANHESSNQPQPQGITCELCGYICSNSNGFNEHKRWTHGEFQRVGYKICKYFVRGGCFKGDQCLFSHPYEKQFKAAPKCRNGRNCPYLARGVCTFFHPMIGVQQPIADQQPSNQAQNNISPPRGWCRYREECRKPNCNFSHPDYDFDYEQDFPKLNNANNPPIRQRSWGWEDY